MSSDKISRKIEFISHKIKYLTDFKPANAAQFRDDETTQMAILYAIHVAIEALMDIVIITEVKRTGNHHTGDYERITSLFESGLIKEDIDRGLRKLNGLRNAIVHAYDSLVLDEIYEGYDKIVRDIVIITEYLYEISCSDETDR